MYNNFLSESLILKYELNRKERELKKSIYIKKRTDLEWFILNKISYRNWTRYPNHAYKQLVLKSYDLDISINVFTLYEVDQYFRDRLLELKEE